MSLDASLAIANSGLYTIGAGFSVISQNIANANTPGYASEIAVQESVDAGPFLLGVRSLPAILASDPAVQAALQDQSAGNSYWQTTGGALSGLQPAWGAVAQGNDLGSLVSGVQNAFTALLNDPANQTAQGAVVSAAQSLAAGINAQSQAITGARQAAEGDLVSAVGQANDALGKIAALNAQIVGLQASGQSTADLQNQRNAAVATLSGLFPVRTSTASDGALLVFTAGGAQLPTDGSAKLQITPATLGPGSYYPGGGVSGITLGGSDILAQLGGGRIGADLALRDRTLPTYQGELDEFAYTLTNRFDAQGPTLFSNPDGTLPVAANPGVNQAGYVGYAAAISVNPAVAAHPSLVRDGTHAVVGSPTGASAFTPNPLGLPGFTDMIQRVLNYSLTGEVQAGVAQAPGLTAGLGPAGNLAAPFGATLAIGDTANAITGAAAADSAAASSAAGDAQATAGALQGKLSASTGVNMDQELSTMVALENAYGANAKIISTVQTLYGDVLAMVQ